MDEISPLAFEGNPIRLIQDDTGEPWFVGKDVCDALGLGNSRSAIGRLADDEKNTVSISDGKRGNPNSLIINEPGVYRLIMTSRSASAERFKRWLCHVVLPAIRSTGQYKSEKYDPEKEDDEFFFIPYTQYSEMKKEIYDLRGKLIDYQNKIIDRKIIESNKHIVHVYFSETQYTNEEIALRLQENIGEYMPEWVAWQRRLLAEAG